MDPDAEEASGNAIKLPAFVYIIYVLYKYFSSDMKLYNDLSFQHLFSVSSHPCSFGNNKKLTSLLIRANIYITTEDKVVRRC